MFLILRLLSFGLALLPEAAHRALAAASGELLFHLARRRRRAVLSNLSHAFPDQSHAWLVRTGRASCRQTAETAILALLLPWLSDRRVRRLVRPGPGFRDAVSRVAAARRPTVLATPHLGAWELTCTLPMMADGRLREVGSVYRPLKNPRLDAWVRSARERFGVRMLSRREGFAEGMRMLRRGGVFAVLFDQGAGEQGELTLFFDRICSSTNLPGLLVEKFEAQLVTYYARRTAFWRYELVFEPVPPTNQPRDAAAVTRFLDRWLEQLLRTDEALCPTWLWLHNRWKTQDVPARRLRLEHKRSLLPDPAVGTLPRRTRFFVRLPNWLGDVVMTLPLLRALRLARPDVEITAVGRDGFAPLLACTGLCERFVALPPSGVTRWGQVWQLRRSYPDCWLLFTNSARGDLEAWLAGSPQRFGIARPGRSRPFVTHAWSIRPGLDETRLHQTDVWRRFLQHFGLPDGELDRSPLDLPKLPDPLPDVGADARWIGLIAGTENDPAKRWPVAHWCALLESLRAADPRRRFVLFGTAADASIARAIAGNLGEEHALDLAGRTDLVAFAGALRQCALVITNDSGGMHLANALGRPVLALFGPTNPVRTGPIFAGPTTVLQPPDCAPTGGGVLADLAPEAVAQAAERILAGHGRTG